MYANQESITWRTSTMTENSSLGVGLKLLSILLKIQPGLKIKYIFQLRLNLEWKNQNDSTKVKAIAAATVFRFCDVTALEFAILRNHSGTWGASSQNIILMVYLSSKKKVESKVFQVTPIKQKKEVYYGLVLQKERIIVDKRCQS